MLPVELGWEVNAQTGWGLFSMHLAIGLARQGRQVYIGNVNWDGIPMTVRPTLEKMQEAGDRSERRIRVDGSGNHFPSAPDVPNRLKVCLAVFEDTQLPPEKAGCWASFDKIVACSTWAQGILKGWGHQSDLWFQGYDDSLFHPAPRRRPNDGRFYVFSGGKLEFRKGQDIVVAAFREFLQTPEGRDAVLVTAWQNRWPATMESIWESGYVKGVPVSRLGTLDISSWLEANGVPRENSLDLGMIRQADFASVIRECDVGLFPNRAEGATNMVVPEVMACGIPIIASQNTGHLDSAPFGTAFPLKSRGPVTIKCPVFEGMDGWGEVSVGETMMALQEVRTCSHIMPGAADFARDNFGWQRQAAAFNALLTRYEQE